MSDMEEKLQQKVSDYEEIRLVQDGKKSYFISEERYRTDTTLFYIPIASLYKMLHQRKHKRNAHLLLSVCTYLYHIADIGEQKITLEIRLTPGVDVVSSIIKYIDSNNDNIISNKEKNAYVEKLKKDISLTLNSHSIDLQLDTFYFPDIPTIKKGIGDIIVQFYTKYPYQSGNWRLEYRNHHLPSIGTYLVNCLAPNEKKVQIIGQNRNYDQSIYDLDFSIGRKIGISKNKIDSEDKFAIIKSYFVHGVIHILTGYDHLLFLVALVITAQSFWELFKVVTAFTIAHSITLTLGVLNIVHLSESIVEPFISASIVFVAVQIFFLQKQSKGNIRIIVAFLFGLFHGLGFAGSLHEIMHTLPKSVIFLSILGFTLGIEAGNQLVILPFYFIFRKTRTMRSPTLQSKGLYYYIQICGSAIIAIAGAYYFFLAIMT